MNVKQNGQSTQLTGRLSEHILIAPSLAKLVDGYLLTLKSESKSPKTVAYHSVQLRNFHWYCQEYGIPIDVERITTSHCRQFLTYVRTNAVRWGGTTSRSKKPVSQTTLRHYYTSLHVFFNWLVCEGIIASNPLSGIQKPKLQQKVVQPFTQEDIRRLLALCDNRSLLGIRNRAILMLFLDTGLRLSELASLKFPDIDFQNSTVFVRSGKGGKQRIVHIGNRCQRALWRWLLHVDDDSRRVFGLEARGISQMFERLCEKARVAGGQGVHRLRHTFAIEFLRAGGDVMSLQYLLGHSSLEMVKRYLGSLNADDAARAHKKFSPMDRMELR